MSAEASEMVSIPRVELDALRAELRRLRREVGRARIGADHGPADGTRMFDPNELAGAWGISE